MNRRRNRNRQTWRQERRTVTDTRRELDMKGWGVYAAIYDGDDSRGEARYVMLAVEYTLLKLVNREWRYHF
jgi:hypothetical protein